MARSLGGYVRLVYLSFLFIVSILVVIRSSSSLGRSTAPLYRLKIKAPWDRGSPSSATPAPHRMLHKQRFFFLASKAIVFAVSRVYGWSLLTGYLTNVTNPTFGGAAGDTLAHRVHLHAVPESRLLLPSGTVTSIAPIGLTRRARLPFVCATTLGVVGGDLQLGRGALLLARFRLSKDTWSCRRKTWKWEG